MSDWVSVLAVFWALWALDGVKLAAHRGFTLVGRGRRSRARVAYSRLSFPGPWPWNWRVNVADVPVSLSPAGVSNRGAGAAGRPAEGPAQAQAWRWEDVREVGVARGWIYVNGQAFCPDTGHVRAAELLEFARLPAGVREKRIHAIIGCWFPPADLRRRTRVLAARTIVPAGLNGATLLVLLALTIYVIGDAAPRLPEHVSARIAGVVPWVLLGLLGLHVAAVVLAWRAVGKLKAVRPEKRRSNLVSALLLPPHALRLRALVGEGFFPAVHPLAAIAAWADARERQRAAFHALADLRWPIGEANDAPLAREVAAWFRRALEPHVVAAAGTGAAELLAPPWPDAPDSCRYCPRCRDQFVAGPSVCPHGVPLLPVRSRR